MNKATQRPNEVPTKKWVRKDILKRQERKEWLEWESQQNPHIGY